MITDSNLTLLLLMQPMSSSSIPFITVQCNIVVAFSTALDIIPRLPLVFLLNDIVVNTHR